MLVPPLSRRDYYPVEFNLVITIECILQVLTSIQSQFQLANLRKCPFSANSNRIREDRNLNSCNNNKIDVNHTNVVDSRHPQYHHQQPQPQRSLPKNINRNDSLLNSTRNHYEVSEIKTTLLLLLSNWLFVCIFTSPSLLFSSLSRFLGIPYQCQYYLSCRVEFSICRN